MTISELRQSPHLSASSINDYIDCGMLYKLSRIDMFQPEFKSDAMEFGIVIHKALAYFYEEKMSGNKLPVDELIEAFETYWRQAAEDNEEIKYKEGKDFTTLLKDGKELISTFYSKLPDDNFHVLAIEEPISFEIEGVPLPVVGVIDLIETDESGTIIVTDFKTSSKAYSNDEIDNNLQMTLYHLAMKANGYSDREILLKFDILIKTKTPKFEQHYLTRTDDDERKAVKKIRQVWEGINKGVFVPNDNNWKCKGCFYKSYCDDWFRR